MSTKSHKSRYRQESTHDWNVMVVITSLLEPWPYARGNEMLFVIEDAATTKFQCKLTYITKSNSFNAKHAATHCKVTIYTKAVLTTLTVKFENSFKHWTLCRNNSDDLKINDLIIRFGAHKIKNAIIPYMYCIRGLSTHSRHIYSVRTYHNINGLSQDVSLQMNDKLEKVTNLLLHHRRYRQIVDVTDLT